jgi:DNA-binding NtrC family response regulator
MKTYAQELREWQTKYIKAALKAADGSVVKAARATGINRTHFYKMMRKLGIEAVERGCNKGNAAWQSLGRADHGMGA